MMDSVSVLVGDLILRQWPYQLLHFKLSTELLPFFSKIRVHLIITQQWWKRGHICNTVLIHYN